MATPTEAVVDMEARPTSTATVEAVATAEAVMAEELAATACLTSEPVCRSRTGVSWQDPYSSLYLSLTTS